MPRIDGKPEFQRLRQEWAVKLDVLHKRHEAETDEFNVAYIGSLEDSLDVELTAREITFELVALTDEVFPSHNLNHHEFYQHNPDVQDEGREGFYRDHPEFVDGEAS